MRESSPPDATRSMGFSGSPGLAAIAKDTASAPPAAGSVGMTRTKNATFSISKNASSRRTPSCRRSAATARVRCSSSAQRRSSSSAFLSALPNSFILSSALTISESRAAASRRNANTSATVAPYFRSRRLIAWRRLSTRSSAFCGSPSVMPQASLTRWAISSNSERKYSSFSRYCSASGKNSRICSMAGCARAIISHAETPFSF